jgi:hypothetical protein
MNVFALISSLSAVHSVSPTRSSEHNQSSNLNLRTRIGNGRPHFFSSSKKRVFMDLIFIFRSLNSLLLLEGKSSTVMFLSLCNHEGHFFFITGALGCIKIATAGAFQNSRPYSHDIFMRRIFNRRNCLDIRRDSIFGSPGSIKRQRLVRRHHVQVLSCRPPNKNQKKLFDRA